VISRTRDCWQIDRGDTVLPISKEKLEEYKKYILDYEFIKIEK
jgi:hypothetical protein